MQSSFKIKSKDNSYDAESRINQINGVAEMSFKHKDNNTALDHLYYCEPLKVMFPTPVDGDVLLAAIITIGGGLFGGDSYQINASLDHGASALITPQAAEKIYKSKGVDCLVDVNLDVSENASLEWLPQETIIFNKARFRRRTNLTLAKGAKALVGEILVFGRRASGEELNEGLIRDQWHVKIDDKLIWADALHLDGNLAETLNHPAAFNGASAYATAIYAADNAPELLEISREILGAPDHIRCGVSLVNGLLVFRWLATDAYCLRQTFGKFWQEFRAVALNRPAELPLLWHI